MATKPQVKTQKILDLIKVLKSRLRTNNDLGLHIYTYNDNLSITYGACVRRSTYYDVVKQYYKDINNFIDIVNSSTLIKSQKIKKVSPKDFEEDTEYSEYEIEFNKDISFKLGKNQSKFFEVFE